jgi:membrane protein YdbS with pleckstrin-like domain
MPVLNVDPSDASDGPAGSNPSLSGGGAAGSRLPLSTADPAGGDPPVSTADPADGPSPLSAGDPDGSAPSPSAGDPTEGRPPLSASVSAGVANGAIRSLDPRVVTVNRLSTAIAGAIVVGLHLLVVAGMWLAQGPGWDTLLVSAAWLPVALLFVWLAIAWPRIDYRRWQYRVDDRGIEIWSGVVWRAAVVVPRSRVQHIDVSQGPLERSWGLATLSIHTAGTQHSKVDLPGLDHAVALAVRDALLPKDAEPAV